jgi:succinate dehydrogenase / fumarate reductase cytochrome b subunit
MAVSITVRMTGAGLYLGAFMAAAWAIALAAGPQAYAGFKALVGSIPGKLVMIGLTFSFFFHFAGGIRHLVFDAGYGFSPKAATQSAAAVVIFAVAATAVTWLLAYAVGAA